MCQQKLKTSTVYKFFSVDSVPESLVVSCVKRTPRPLQLRMESYPGLSDLALRTMSTLTEEEMGEMLGWKVVDPETLFKTSPVPDTVVATPAQTEPKDPRKRRKYTRKAAAKKVVDDSSRSTLLHCLSADECNAASCQHVKQFLQRLFAFCTVKMLNV
ncbi:uncharacterized protein LOC113215363 [Frankliniella occidentalis]|uniref:Uncharacterized protein LOC113215363 n=1 Tax=Frankliniella occidentalis TaxID=133901 RepID=A0A6J1TG93_FRAOC|nr:uncharacterized protein LOC113215363 [Frankliniella occidentalis]